MAFPMRTNPILYALYTFSAAYTFVMGSFAGYQPTNDQFPVEEAPPVRTIELIPRMYGALMAASSTGAVFIRNNSELASFAAESGKMLFNFGNSSFYAAAQSGNAIIGTPPTDARQEIQEVSANGDIVWRVPLPAHPQAVTLSPDGTLYASIGYSHYAISPSHKTLWHRDDIEPPAPAITSAYPFITPYVGNDGTIHSGLKAPAIAPDGTVYVNADTGFLLAFSPSGDKLWSTSVQQNGVTGLSDPVVGADGRIYIINGRDLVAISPEGKALWRYTAPVSPYWWWMTRPAVSKNRDVYLVRHGLFCISEDGKEKWRFHLDTPGDFFITPPTVGPDGTVYLPSQGTSGGQTYALSPDGRKKWSLPLQTYSGIPVISIDPERVWMTSNGKLAVISVGH
jgi:hypothetical protein